MRHKSLSSSITTAQIFLRPHSPIITHYNLTWDSVHPLLIAFYNPMRNSFPSLPRTSPLYLLSKLTQYTPPRKPLHLHCGSPSFTHYNLVQEKKVSNTLSTLLSKHTVDQFPKLVCFSKNPPSLKCILLE